MHRLYLTLNNNITPYELNAARKYQSYSSDFQPPFHLYAFLRTDHQIYFCRVYKLLNSIKSAHPMWMNERRRRASAAEGRQWLCTTVSGRGWFVVRRLYILLDRCDFIWSGRLTHTQNNQKKKSVLQRNFTKYFLISYTLLFSFFCLRLGGM